VEHLLTVDAGEVSELADALAALRREVRLCEECSLLTETERCAVCRDPDRDRSTVLVVEEPTTAWAVEATREYRGLYHALLGHLSPLHGVGPEDLTIDAWRAVLGRRRPARSSSPTRRWKERPRRCTSSGVCSRSG
jgi:recombination protein RecR